MRSSQDDAQEKVKQPLVKIRADYEARGLDKCHFCGLKFNVGERIPRIIIGCGHTFCTSCLGYFLRNDRIRCPLCRKILKNVESVDKLPLNFNILYEIVTKDPLLSRVNFEKCLNADPDLYQDDEAYERDFAPYMCQKHEQRIKHFYCSEHPSIFCRECIKDLHNLEACFVVDLYEIEKMRKLQQQNNDLNQRQLKRRQDGATKTYVQYPETPASLKEPLLLADTLERKPRHEPRVRAPVPEPQQPLSNGGYMQPPHCYPVPPGKGLASVGHSSNAIVEFDANQFDEHGFVSKKQLLAAQQQHHHMLMAAGQNHFTQQQQHYVYGHHGQEEHDEASFRDDDDDDDDDEENGEEEDGDSDYGDEEANQAKKLKRDMMLMRLRQNKEFSEEEVKAHQALLASMEKDPTQIQFLQQMQLEEAMRIQMAMKQIPQEDGGQGAMGLRWKKNYDGVEDDPQTLLQAQGIPATDSTRSPEDSLTQQEQFKLDKKLFAEQMKQQLYGKSATKPKCTSAEEMKQGRQQSISSGSDDDQDDYDDEDDDEEEDEKDDDKSCNSQIEIGEAELAGERQEEDFDANYQTPPVATKY